MIYINNKWGVVKDYSQQDLNFFKTNFTIEDFSKCYMNGKFNKDYVTYKKFFFVKEEEKSIIFFAQLIDYIEQNFPEFLTRHTIKDTRKKLNFSFETIKDFNLRDYQLDCLKKINSSCIIEAPTGAGKTHISLALIKLLLEETKGKILYIAPNVDILKKTIETAKQFFPEEMLGLTCTNNNICDKPIQFSTPQSAGKNDIEEYKILIYDEVHTASSPTIQQLLKSHTFDFLFGFSATPFVNQLNKIQISQFFGKKIVIENYKNLIENNFLTKPTFIFLKVDYPLQFKDKARYYKDLPYLTIEQNLIVENEYRNKKIVEVALKEAESGNKVLILVKLLRHKEILKELFEKTSFVEKIYYLDGNEKGEKRSKVIKEIESNKEGTIIITSQIFKQGVDIPSLNVLILADGMSAEYLALQKAGRVLRIAENKKDAKIYDFWDNFLPLLYNRTKKREKSYKKIANAEIKTMEI